ncbi:MAG TPA: FCD domain-containing protein [Mycobacteriales bacterium]
MSNRDTQIHQTPDLHRLSGGRVAERVVQEIRLYIDSNNLEAGHKLPPERFFIEQLGVSRSSLREAMRVLSTLGLVEVRHGDGTYVTAPPETWNASSPAIFDATEENALRNLVETRMGIELAAATAATERATEEDFNQLEEFIDTQTRALAEDPAFRWQPLGFELIMVEVTGNTWLYEVELMLREAWQSLSGGLRASVGRNGEWLNEHRAILASMRTRNVLQVQRLVMAHLSLERFEEDLRSQRSGPTSTSRRGRSTKGRN